jgi:hypothetical protein
LLIKPLGLLGVALGTMLAQILTNNWYAVYHPIKRLKLNFQNYLVQVVVWWGLLLVSSFSISKVIQQLLTTLDFKSDWLMVIVSGLVSGIIFLLFCWYKILTGDQQMAFIRKTKMLLNFN